MVSSFVKWGQVNATLRVLGVFLKTAPCRVWPLVLATQLNEKQTAPLVETLEKCMTWNLCFLSSQGSPG